MLSSINPYDGQIIEKYAIDSQNELENKLHRAKQAFKTRSQSLQQKLNQLSAVIDDLSDNEEQFAQTITLEMGKPIKEARAEVAKCATLCEFYQAHAEQFLSDQLINTTAQKSYVSYQPLGVILGIMPWNFPFWQAFRFIVPTLLAGNSILLKHASNVQGCAQLIVKIFQEAGFDDGSVELVILPGHETSQLIAHPAISAVSLTGSTGAGQKVATACGQHLKKCVLELGGSDPYLILPDADLDLAVKQCINGRYKNAGQSCIAAKRWIVDKSILDDFTAKVLVAARALKVGDPMKEDTDIGPMAMPAFRDDLHQQVTACLDQGAARLLGGEPLDGPGAFYPVTLLTDVDATMVAFKEELFGPVGSIVAAENVEEAIILANQTQFGLGGAVFTQNLDLGEDIIRNRLQAGSCFLNHQVVSDPRLPFGGIKQSGFGRELGQFGLHEFVNIKTVYIH